MRTSILGSILGFPYLGKLPFYNIPQWGVCTIRWGGGGGNFRVRGLMPMY